MRTFVMSTPSNMRRILNGSAGMPAWHAWQAASVVAVEALERSRLRVGMSTVHASAVQPASSARFSMRSRRRPVRRRIELEPTRPAARRRNVLDGQVRDRRQYLQRVLALGRARDGDFAFGMEHELRADGAQHDRRAQALAEHVDGEIDGADVDEPPRPEADLLERRRGSRRSCRGRRSPARRTRSGRRSGALRIAVSKSQTLTASLRARDDAVEVERAGEHRVVLGARNGCGQRAAEAVEQGALGQETQEVAARFGANVGRHAGPPEASAPPYHRFCGRAATVETRRRWHA